MRIAVISDSHTRENIEFILNYLREKALELKLDLIIINGDVLGQNEIREGYGYNYSKQIFETSLDKDKILRDLSGSLFENLKKISAAYHQGINDEKLEFEFAEFIKEYVNVRYIYLFEILERFSKIKKTYFNIGTSESPLLYNVLKELSFFLDVNEAYIRKIALLSNYREAFKLFQQKFKDSDQKRLRYIAGSSVIEGDLLIIAIPGMCTSSIPADHESEYQEQLTLDLTSQAMRHLGYVNKLLVLNQCQGKLTKEPFAFRPASQAVRKFIEKVKGKLRNKVFIQSYHHLMTTHFYTASEFNFILNNAAVNNCLFNIIDIGQKTLCYDVDSKLGKIRQLNLYNYDVADYNSAEERLKLNYPDSEEVIKERRLTGCYYM
jgi:hypothetical protein